MRRKIKDKVVEEVARELHGYLSYATLSMYYTIRKLIDSTSTDEEREEAGKLVDKMMVTAESLFDDLTDEQKKSYKEIALILIRCIR